MYRVFKLACHKHYGLGFGILPATLGRTSNEDTRLLVGCSRVSLADFDSMVDDMTVLDRKKEGSNG